MLIYLATKAYKEPVTNCTNPNPDQIILDMYTYREYILYIRMLRYTFYMPFGPHYDFCTLLFQSTYQVKCSI